MEQAYDTDGVRGVLHQPDNPTGEGIALTHGAGCQLPGASAAQFCGGSASPSKLGSLSMEQAYDTDGVRGVLHQPDNPTGEGIALTHGAGANCQAPLLVRLARAFCDAGLVVLRYDLPFRQQRPKGPPFPAMAERDREGVLQAVDVVRRLAPGRIFAGGHSYGGRQTAMAAAEHPKMADALLLLSYPLHPPGKPDQLRTSYFPDLRIPALFVHGSADAFDRMTNCEKRCSSFPPLHI
ncbi:MAG: alpha/beta fold hydrolase [Ignavibacteriota bacterium]